MFRKMESFLLFLLVCAVYVEWSHGFRMMNAMHRMMAPSHLKMGSETSSEEKPALVRGKKWPGNRPPVSNPLSEGLQMDASWGRGKYRDEIWEDNLSPSNEWWRAFEPSDEEYEALELGYDFSNPRQWHQERGLDYDKAWAETLRLNKQGYEKYLEVRASIIELLNQTPQKFDELQTKRNAILAAHNDSEQIDDYSDEEVEFLEYFYEVKCIKQELEYRKFDDERQKAKGQPSLQFEDTGSQYLNTKADKNS